MATSPPLGSGPGSDMLEVGRVPSRIRGGGGI